MNSLQQINAQYETEIGAQPCGCPECDNGVQQGHFACEQSRDDMLTMEKLGMAVRAYDDGRWRWFPTFTRVR